MHCVCCDDAQPCGHAPTGNRPGRHGSTEVPSRRFQRAKTISFFWPPGAVVGRSIVPFGAPAGRSTPTNPMDRGVPRVGREPPCLPSTSAIPHQAYGGAHRVGCSCVHIRLAISAESTPVSPPIPVPKTANGPRAPANRWHPAGLTSVATHPRPTLVPGSVFAFADLFGHLFPSHAANRPQMGVHALMKVLEPFLRDGMPMDMLADNEKWDIDQGTSTFQRSCIRCCPSTPSGHWCTKTGRLGARRSRRTASGSAGTLTASPSGCETATASRRSYQMLPARAAV